MKRFFIIHICLCIFIISYAEKRNTIAELSGKITDKLTGNPIAGATIYIPDLKCGTQSAADGSYRIKNLPSSNILLQISCTGYKSITEKIDLSITSNINFALEISVTEIDEVVITGHTQSTEKNKSPIPITIITNQKLIESTSSNIIDAISKQPGISHITTGSSISKPIIRGLGYNRLTVLVDGVKQEGQQWGDEHGIEVDEFSVNKVEILKGPGSLSYGSDALAGVINLLGAPSLPNGKISSNVISNYQSNNGLIAYSGNTAGNLNGLIWSLRLSGKQAHTYKNKFDDYVLGSGFKENGINGMIGLNKSWGYTHLNFSIYLLLPEIAEGERDSATGKFIKPFALNDSTIGYSIPTNNELKTYKLNIPHQKINHHKIVLNNSFVIKGNNIKTTIAWQQNHRKEFTNILSPEEYELYFLMNTINYDAHIIMKEIKNWNISSGINGMWQHSKNKGEKFLIPEYKLWDAGVYTIFKKSINKIDLSGGARYDFRSLTSYALFLDSLGIPTNEENPFHIIKFNYFKKSFSNITASLGATYTLTKTMYTKLNLAKGFRAPNISELASNGEHEGTYRYEIGNSLLKPENSLQLDYSIGLNTEHVSAEADLFYNKISNYIFSEKLKSVTGGDSIVEINNPIPAFKFRQGNAQLYGGEITIDIHPHPLDWLHFENSFSIVNAMQENATDSTKYLPFTPAPKYSSELRAEFDKTGKRFNATFFSFETEYYFKQNKIYSAYNTETITPNYILFNISIGTNYALKNHNKLGFYISANNLTDVCYQSHLSRLKYTPVNYATGRTGIYNMGRNISFKLVLSIESDVKGK